MTTSIFGVGQAIAVNVAGTLVSERFVASPGQTVFSLSNFIYTINTNSLMVFLNGGKQRSGPDFSETSSTSFTLQEACEGGEIVEVIGFPELDLTAVNAGSVTITSGYSLADFISDLPISVKAFGATGDGITDDTAAIQAAIYFVTNANSLGPKALYFPSGNYSVTQISFDMPPGAAGQVSGIHVICDGIIVGKATGNYSSVVEIMAGYATFDNLTVSANSNPDYECAVHWYTNDLSKNYPGEVRLNNLITTSAVIGLCIGMLPSQNGVYYNQAAVQAKPIAIDAPVSECAVNNLTTQFCVKGLHVQQPNGKIPFSNPKVSGVDDLFTGYENQTMAFAILWGEVNFLGGFIENIAQPLGFLGILGDTAGGVTFNTLGTVIESVSPLVIIDNATVRIANDANWGANGDVEFIWIYATAKYQLTLSDGFMLRGWGTTYSKSLVKVVVDLTGAGSYNHNFKIDFDNVRFSNPNFQSQTATYQPLVKGCKANYSNCWMTVLDINGVVTESYKFDPKDNLLLGEVDLAAKTITAYGANGNATSGGWTFAVSSGAVEWGRYAVGLPTILGTPVNNALRITAGASGGGASVTSTSPKFNVMPGSFKLITGYIKTLNAGNNFAFRLNFYDFGGTASALDPQWDAFFGLESQFYINGFLPFELWFQVPADATQAELVIYAENGADLIIFDLAIS